MKHILLLIIFIPNIAFAQYFEPFSTQDWVLQTVYTGFTIIDWAQTKKFRASGRKELNPALGTDPDQKTIDGLIFLGIAADWAFIYAIPEKWRPYLQMFSIGVETHAVIVNHKNGIRISVGFGF